MNPTNDAAGEVRADLPEVEAPLVSSHGELTDLCAELLREPVVALDTEFVRTRTFYPRLGLVQVGWRDRVALLDAVALEEWEPFIEVLCAPEVVKVMHSPSEDLEVFHCLSGSFPHPIFDTQTAATLAGLGGNLGYQRLVAELEGVDLPKGEQRSNWLRRPLTESQRRYAALDVVYLVQMAERIGQELLERERWPWLVEEMESALQTAAERLQPEQQFSRLARSSMNEEELRALYALNAWRESEARARDLPRRFVIGDDVLIEAAKKRPKSTGGLRQLSTLDAKSRKRFGAALVEAVQQGDRSDLELEAPPRRGSKRNADHKRQIEEAKSTVEAVGEAHELPAELLLPRRSLERLVDRSRQGEPWQEELSGWRRELLLEPLQRVLAPRVTRGR